MGKSTFTFIQGNTKEGLQFTVTDKNTGLAIDITGCTVTFKVSSEDLLTSLFTKACTLTTPLSGICTYVPDATNFDVVGRYAGELHILFPDATIGRKQGIKIIITDKAPG